MSSIFLPIAKNVGYLEIEKHAIEKMFIYNISE